MISRVQLKMKTQIPLFEKQKDALQDTKILFKLVPFFFLISFSLDQSVFNLLFNVVFSVVGDIPGKVQSFTALQGKYPARHTGKCKALN